MKLIDADKLSEKIQDDYHGGYLESQIAPYEVDRMLESAPEVRAIAKKTLHETMGNVYDRILKYDGENSYLRFDAAEQNAVARAFAMLEVELDFPSDFGEEDPDEKKIERP